MQIARTRIPAHLWLLVAIYFVASLLHFSHNAEYIALYPNMPAWITRENVYLAWLAVSGVGLLAAALWIVRWRATATIVLGFYGLLGVAGLAHYALALCSEHALVMNLTIWFEVLAGSALAGASFLHSGNRGNTLTRNPS
jgi:hypothetical protein